MNLHVSAEIAGIVDRAAAASVNRGQFFVGVEHLFAALLEEPEGLPSKIAEQWLTVLHQVQRELVRNGWAHPVATPAGEVVHTPRAIKALSACARLAQRHGRGSACAGHLLLAILSDPLASPARVMDGLAQDRHALLEQLRHELQAANMARPSAGTGSTQAASPAPEAASPSEREPVLETLTRNLTEMARRGDLHPAIGRDAEMLEMMQVLTRKTKNNVMLVGEAGVGKTQLVEGLALRLARQRDDFGHFQVLELNLAALMSGTQYRGAFEEKLLALIEQLKQSPDTILFVDEVHLIMGAGATDGDSMNLANLLKPALARGEIRCIGATTVQEYRKFIEKDPAVERRFQMVRVEELTEQATLAVLLSLRPSFEKHHRIKISSRALDAAIQLTQRHLPHLRLPDKAIDVVDQACAGYRLQAAAGHAPAAGLEEEKITPHDIRKIVSQITRVPLEEITGRERMHLTDLERRIRKRLIGQDEAVARAVAAVKKSRAGLADPNRPDAVMLFLGPSGVGKTHLAKLLAEELYGSTRHLFVFDMSEYVEEHSVAKLLGAPPGYAGHEEEGRLTAAVRSTPFCILLFDEIEKAHPRVFDIFLPLFDEGRIRDTRGRDISFRNTIIILTSNIGAYLISGAQMADVHRPLLDELRRHFRPELINRIDDIVPFHALLSEDVRSILFLEMKQIKKRLDEKQIGLRVYQRAYEYLAQQGYQPEFGARELRRVVDRLVTTPISDLIVSGELRGGDVVDVVMDEGEFVVRRGTQAPAVAAG